MRLRNEEIMDFSNTVEVPLIFLFSYLFSKLIFFTRKAGIAILFFVFVLFSKNEIRAQQVIGSFPTMDGGFEAQSGSLANTSVAGGVQRTDWTSSSTGTTVNSTGGRSGPKYITFNKNSGCTTACGTATHIRIQSPTAALGAIAASTSYTIQFYYKINATSATTGGLRAAISDSGTVSMGSYTTVATNISNTNWVKAQVSASTNSTPSYYGLAVIDPYFSVASTLIYDFDDFVVYAGAADNTAPGDPTAVVVNGATTSSLNVSWTAPAGGLDGGGYIVVRYATSPNADNDPNQNGIYATGNTITNGTGGLTGTIVYIGTGTSFTDNGLSASSSYFYKVYAVDKAFNYSNEASGNATTTAPAITSFQNGNWSNPATWVGGVVPAASQNVLIASGHTVTVDVATTRNAGTTTTVNGTLETNVTYTDNGTATINGAFRLNQGSWATGSNFVYGSSGTLVFNNSSGLYGVNNIDVFWPTSNGPFNVTVQNNAGGIQMNTSRTVSGTFQTAAQVNLNGNTLTINGVNQLNAGGYFSQSPTYGSNATLVYNSTYSVSVEWTGNSATPGIGIPKNVTIQNSAIVTMPTTTRGIGGNISINSGTLVMSTNSGSDLYVGGNWTIASGASFTSNSRAVFFNGSAVQNITGNTTFAYLFINNSAGISLQTASDITIINSLTLTNGKITTGSSKVVISSTGSVARTNGWVYGNLQKYFTAGTAVQQIFEVGGSANYLPDTVWANVDVAGSLLLSCTDGDHPNIATSQLNNLKSINRYWNITNVDASVSSYDASFNYLVADVDAGATASLFQSSYFNSPDWVLYAVISVFPAYFRLNSSTLYGNIAVGESKTYLFYKSIRSGSWTSDTTWQVSNDNQNWVNAPSGFFPDAITASVIIQSGHTVLKTDKNPRSIKNLTVNTGGSLFAASTVGQPTYISLYGSILCNGNIGTGANDSIAFNIDGVNDTISGSGTFKCQRLRKNYLTNLQTNLVVSMNVATGFGSSSTTSVYNNAGTSFFNIIVKSGATLNASSISIDGIKGLGSGRNSGTYSIYGTLNVSDTLFATTDNGSASYPCNIIIYNGGVLNTKLLKASASGLAKHTISVQNGGRLNITGAAGFYLFSNTNNVYDFQPGSTVEYSATANQTVESGIPFYDNIIFSGSGNKTANGNLNIKGNWSRTLPAIFDPSNKTVFFNGTAGNQTITITGAGGAESFSYLVVNKPSAQSLQLASSPATDISINGGLGGYTLQLQSGNLDLNGRTCIFFMAKNGNNNNIGIDGSAGNPARNINSSLSGGLFRIYNPDNAARFTMIRSLSANPSTLNFNANVILVVGGISQNSGVDFGANLTTINSVFRIDTWGYVETNPPYYGNASTLIYNSGGSYKRYMEWSALSGAGYPNDIIVQNNTSLRVNDDNIPVNNNGNGTADRAMAGSFTIANGAVVIMGDSTENNKLTIGQDFNLIGTINMPSTTAAIGADLYIGRNWNRASTGVFNHNERAVFFNGSANSTITASGGQYFPYLYLVKSSSTPTLTLADHISIGKEFTVNTGTLALGAKDVTMLSNATATSRFGPVGADGRINYTGNGRFIVERYIPVSVTHGKSWQLLAVPTNGGQTVKQAWQEGASLPNQNPVPGYGTQLTSNITNATSPSLGFDVFTASGPSIKTLINGIWTGIPNTTTTPIYNPSGYMVFVRGSRIDTTFNSTTTSTILRTRGKVFDPVGNPVPSITVQPNSYTSIGNPYASAIEFTSLDRPGVPDIDNVFWVWDPLLSGAYGFGGYQMISGNNGDYYATPGGTANYPSGVRCSKIQSGQAFLMHSTLPGTGGLVNFSESVKTTGSANTFRPVLNPNSRYLRVYLQGSSLLNNRIIDGVVVVYNTAFDNQIDHNDALKMTNIYENMAISRNGTKLSLEARKTVIKRDTVFLYMSYLRRQDYQLAFAPENLSRGGLSARLVDKFLNTVTDISTSDSTRITFSITADPGSYATDRFYIIFANTDNNAQAIAITDIIQKDNPEENNTSPSVSVYPNPVKNGQLNLYFSGLPLGAYRLSVQDMLGRILEKRNITISEETTKNQLNNFSFTPGIYNLIISNDKGFVKSLSFMAE